MSTPILNTPGAPADNSAAPLDLPKASPDLTASGVPTTTNVLDPSSVLTATVPVSPTLEGGAAPSATGPNTLYLALVKRSFLSEESILILEPGPGSRLTSPIRLFGEADPTFEQALVARLVLADGSELALVPVQIASELGTRGPFEGVIPFNVTSEQQGFLQVYATSARDGGITHLSSVGISLAPGGAQTINPVTDRKERIAIFSPRLTENVSGGMVRVQGFGLASFEQTLVIEVQDENGDVVGSTPVTVAAPDLGKPGHFSADVFYTVASSGPGRVVVRDISPAFGGDTHLTSVEINLSP